MVQVNNDNTEQTWGTWFSEQLDWAGKKAGEAREWTRTNLGLAAEKANKLFQEAKDTIGHTIDKMGDTERYGGMAIGSLVTAVILNKGKDDINNGNSVAGVTEIALGAMTGYVTAWLAMDSYDKWQHTTEI